MGYKEDFIDLVDAVNKKSYTRFDCNAKQIVLHMKKNISSELKNKRPEALYKIDRGIYLLSMRNNMGHGAFRIADVSKEDVCIVFEVFFAAYYDQLEHKGFVVRVLPGGAFQVSRNGKLCYDISSILDWYRQSNDVSCFIDLILK